MVQNLLEALEDQAKKQGLSRTQLAAKLGISENYMYRIKKGERKPGIDFLTAIRREFPELKELEEYLESLAQ